MARKAAILILLALACVTPVDGKNKTQGAPRNKNGQYNFTVAGFARGQGTAAVLGGTITLAANVTDPAGGKGQLVTAGPLRIKENHFVGKGTILGRSATIEGRLDVPSDDHERAIRGVRLVCMVKTPDGTYSKLVGFIPSQAKAFDKIDLEDQDRGKDKKK
jgi:hypothetical protein